MYCLTGTNKQTSMSHFVTGFLVLFYHSYIPASQLQLSDKMLFTASKQTKTFTLTSHNLKNKAQ
jgi:hypothetical protein